MLTMDQIHHIRALYYEQGYNISEIAKATGRDWKTVAKYIDKTDFNEPLPVPESEKQFCPKLEPYKALIDSCSRVINAGLPIGTQNSRMQALLDYAKETGKLEM